MKAGPVGEVQSPREALCDEDEILRAISAEPDAPNEFAQRDELHRLWPIYFVGDSRAIVFRNRLYVSPHTYRPYELRSVYLRNLHAVDFYSVQRGLNAPLTNALATDVATVSSNGGFRWSANRLDYEREPDGSRFEHGPAPLVLFCGSFDCMRVLDELGPDADVAAWDDASRRCEVTSAPSSRVVPVDEVRRRMFEVLEPFASGIRYLRGIGFERIFVHGYGRARTVDSFGRIDQGLKFLRQYHPNAWGKIRIVLDQELRSIAQRTGARFIAGVVSEDGKTSREYTWDAVHYNLRGALEVVRAVVDVLEGVVE